jgi:glutamate/tyrosine decarboxylase-like PLP-dependent enzyme
VSVLADALASGFNVHAGTWLCASGPTEIELVTIDWLRDALGLPPSAGGLFVSGGSMANLTALAAARRARLGSLSADGVVYCSDQTHSSVARALTVMGLGRDRLHTIAHDGSYRLSVDAVARAIACDRASGLTPFCVVANAGTTNTGAVDPLGALADLCSREGLWLHADGCYGAAAALCAEGRAALDGIDRVDSLSLDPHKWLFQPYGIGCVLVRNVAVLHDAFRVQREYLKDAECADDEPNLWDYGVELTRGFRALKLWMSLKVFGADAFAAAISHGIALARHAEATLRASGRWEIVTPAQLGVVTFRPTGEVAPVQQVVRAMINDGFAMVTSTRLGDRDVVRLCTINPRTTWRDVDETIARLASALEASPCPYPMQPLREDDPGGPSRGPKMPKNHTLAITGRVGAGSGHGTAPVSAPPTERRSFRRR